MTGPITFADYRARSHLLLLGVVHTYRDEGRTTGETWARWRRGGCARLDVEVSRAADVDEIADLRPYADTSGFRCVEEWVDRIEAHHGVGVDDLDGGAVYRVDLLEWRTSTREGGQA